MENNQFIIGKIFFDIHLNTFRKIIIFEIFIVI